MKIALALALAVGLALGACQLLPERLAVNAPLAFLLFGRGVDPPAEAVIRERMRVPKGFSIGIFASDLPNARFLRFTAGGDLLVSQPRAGRVMLLEPDRDGDGRSDAMRPLVDGLNRPHGLDLREGWLYVAETDAVGRVRFDAASGTTQGDFERVVTGLPADANHWTRTLRFGPDDWMYVSVGSSCNVCIEEDERRAAILRFRPDGSEAQTYARGLRNAVGFDWRPESGHLYATDNGRDLLGDDFPPCELNQVVEGGFYGWPFANGDKRPDPDYGEGREAEIEASLAPAFPFRAHTAPLGITFLRGQDLPAEYRNAALVALHGSWNRTEKDGYKVVSLHWEPDGTIREEDFAVGFLVDDDVSGRPVDVAEGPGPDGGIYVSDDYAGVIWRIAKGEAAKQAISNSGTSLPLAEASERADPLAALSADERREGDARGRATYQDGVCTGCHEAAQAEPGVVVVPLEDLAARYDLESLQAFLRAPTPPMPVFAGSDAEARDLAVHLLGR